MNHRNLILICLHFRHRRFWAICSADRIRIGRSGGLPPERGYGFEQSPQVVVATSNVVKAELRRLMVERVDTRPGEFVSRSFIVNVRTARISTGGEVKLKNRER